MTAPDHKALSLALHVNLLRPNGARAAGALAGDTVQALATLYA
jgi:hypothetical protein